MTKTLSQRLDDVAALTHIPAIFMHRPQRRPMRWFPIAALVLATAGLAVLLTSARAYSAGYAIIIFALTFSVWLPACGPIKS